MRYLLLLLFPLLMASDCEEKRLDNLDDVWMVEDGIEVHPQSLPWKIAIDPTVDDPEFGFDRSLIIDVIDNRFHTVLGDGWFTIDDTATPETDSVLLLEVGYTGDDWELFDETQTYGNFYFAYNSSGEIRWGTITISSDITYHEETVEAVLAHELGHSLGLGHDGCSIDLNSIMAECFMITGELTTKDIEALIGGSYDEEDEEN